MGLVGTRSRIVVSDLFDRADSAATLGRADSGQPWTAHSGTWGISSNAAYSATDVTLNLASIEAATPEVAVSAVVNGDIDGGSDFSIPVLVFRMQDANNFLMAYLDGGLVRLLKLDGGVSSTLATFATTTTTGTDYTLKAEGRGDVIVVSKDGTALIIHTLSGGNTKYAGATYTRVGLRLLRGGTPTVNARWKEIKVEVPSS